MVSSTHTSYPAEERSYFAVLKKDIHNKAIAAGFTPAKIGELDIIVSEMTSNLAKYGKQGEILIKVEGEGESTYLELICIDNGPGIADLERMMMDGMSSTNTLGHGLGSMKRLSDFFQIYSLGGWGTIIVSRIYKRADLQRAINQVEIKTLIVPKSGEIVSGDGCSFRTTDQYFKVLLADGLGHGLEANKAVQEGFNAFRVCPYNNPVETLRFMHDSMKKTRGAVATVAFYDFKARAWFITGVGNIAGKMVAGLDVKAITMYNGIVGHNIPRTMNSHEIKLDLYKQIVLCSDGIHSKWDITRYPFINKYDLSILAACIYKDYTRRTDDTSVVVAKILKS